MILDLILELLSLTLSPKILFGILITIGILAFILLVIF